MWRKPQNKNCKQHKKEVKHPEMKWNCLCFHWEKDFNISPLMFCSVRRLKKWNESIKMKMFLSADTLLWELVMKDSEWHSERSDKHGSLFTINTGKFPLQHEPDQPLWLVSCLPSSELQLSHHQRLQKVSGVAASPHESSGKDWSVWKHLRRQTPAATAVTGAQ